MSFKDLFSKLMGKQPRAGIHSPSGKMITGSEGRYRILLGSKALEELSECGNIGFSDIEHIATRVYQTCSEFGLVEDSGFNIFIDAMATTHPEFPNKTMNAARMTGLDLEGVRFDRAIQIFQPALRKEVKDTTAEIEGAYGKAGVALSGEALRKAREGAAMSQTTLMLMGLAREFARLFAADPTSASNAKRKLKDIEVLTDALVFDAFGQDYESAEMYAKNGFLAALGCLCDLVEAERSPQGSFQRFHTMKRKGRECIKNFKCRS